MTDSNWASSIADHEARLAALEVTPIPPTFPPPPSVVLDPTRGGLRLASAAFIETDETFNLSVHEGENDGVKVMILNGIPVIRTMRRPGDAAWKVNLGSRSEYLHFGAAYVGFNETARYVRESLYPAGGFTPRPDGKTDWNVLSQTHSTGSPSNPNAPAQHSPMFGVRNWNGEYCSFSRENEGGSEQAIGGRIHTPSDVWIREETTIYMRPDGLGFAYFNAWNLNTGEVLASQIDHRYDGPTQLVRAGSAYDPRRVRAYRAEGVYMAGGHQSSILYYTRLSEVYNNAA